jgi:hypothetical protein
MPLSKKKQEKMARSKREAYVRSVGIRDSVHIPFSETNWDIAAQKYIETGDESLKADFPSIRRR